MSKLSNHETSTVFFQKELRPNRSSTLMEIRYLCIILCVIFITASMVFLSVGAWPVSSFFGLELFLLITLLNVKHRNSNTSERITITATELLVERIDPRGRSRYWSFPRYWSRVNIYENHNKQCKLELRSHGRSVVIGSFLTSNARREFALQLRKALS